MENTAKAHEIQKRLVASEKMMRKVHAELLALSADLGDQDEEHALLIQLCEASKQNADALHGAAETRARNKGIEPLSGGGAGKDDD